MQELLIKKENVKEKNISDPQIIIKVCKQRTMTSTFYCVCLKDLFLHYCFMKA